MAKENDFHKDLKTKMDKFANKVYDCTKDFPKEEVFGLTSQLRRSTMSVVLNYIEGYARQGKKSLRNFLEISYGSLKESKYLIYFCKGRGYIKEKEYNELAELSDRIGAMLWGIIVKLKEIKD